MVQCREGLIKVALVKRSELLEYPENQDNQQPSHISSGQTVRDVKGSETN